MLSNAGVVGAVVALLVAASPAPLVCTGDCSGDGVVTIDELVVGVAIVLGERSVETCRAFDSNQDGVVVVDEVVTAVGFALATCSASLQRTYALQGTVNGLVAEGQLVFTPTDEIEPNLVKYTIDSFVFGSLTGSGTAEFFTLNNTFSVVINAQTEGQGAVQLTGSAPVLSIPPLVLGEFNVVGNGYTLKFTATQR